MYPNRLHYAQNLKIVHTSSLLVSHCCTFQNLSENMNLYLWILKQKVHSSDITNTCKSQLYFPENVILQNPAIEKECDRPFMPDAQTRTSEMEKRKLLPKNMFKMGELDRLPGC